MSELKDSKPFKLKIFTVLGFLLLFVLYSSNAEARAISELRKKYDNIIQRVANNYNIDAQLIHSIILTESNYNEFAISSKGAVGLMQLMPETARDYGVKNLYNPEENIKGGVRYLRDLINYYNGNLNLSLAAYNAGPEAVKKYGRTIPPYPETKNYVRKVTASYNRNKAIKKRSKIYKFYDESGKVVLTNDSHLYSIYKKRKSD
ncbi:MAG: lytic transglycosylase domain-containing protein [Candidatus Aminicenantes bacterium]|nr:MAG: lytic transglycosylase domain-containing protein [Candidatus Aminicenantes bacterium]